MNSNQPLNDDPHDSVPQSPADDLTFGFTHLQIHDSNSHNLVHEPEETDNNDPEEDEEDDDNDNDNDDDDEGEFTFVCAEVINDGSPTDEVINDGQIRTVFPLFDRSLLSGGDSDSDDGKRRLPIDVQVDKVFIESPRRSPSEHGESDGTIRALAKESEPEMNMKSNSTGFSKLWRFRDEMNRSNSDGRDAFVFLDSTDTATTSESKHNTGKVNVAGGGKGKVVKKVKGKKSTASAHEVYLKQKGGQTEEERRRSYLPYRPGLMGFFTNVNGGLSKNVHPF